MDSYAERKLTTREATRLRGLDRALERVRQIDAEMPVQALSTLLYVQQHPDCSVSDIAEGCEFALSSASRNVAKLSDVVYRNGKGRLGLLTLREDPQSRRRKMVNLSSRGVEFLKALSVDLKG